MGDLCSARICSVAFAVFFALPLEVKSSPASGSRDTHASSPITAARIRAIRDRAMLRPTVKEIAAEVANPLGLKMPYTTKQAIFGTHSPRDVHYFAFPIDDNPKLLLVRIRSEVANFWVCDWNGALLAAAVMTPQEGKVELVPVEGAKAGFDDELRSWAIVDDYAPAAAK